jgi:hypothetical protein
MPRIEPIPMEALSAHSREIEQGGVADGLSPDQVDSPKAT